MDTRQNEPSGVAVHEFVQLLAGWVPDAALSTVRQTLAAGPPATAAAAAVAMVTEHDVPLPADGLAVARSLAGPDALTNVQPVPSRPRFPFWFSAFGPDEHLDADNVDRVMAEAAEMRCTQIAGVWRTWRLPLDDFAEPDAMDEDEEPGPAGPQDGEPAGVEPAGDLAMGDDPRPSAALDPRDPGRAYRVYVVQVPDSALAPTLAGELQAALARHGDAGVEVVALDTVPPPYQAAALEGAALLWAAQDGEPSFQLARVFDFAKPGTGPGFHPGHRVVTDPVERDRVLEYLASGTPVLYSTARTGDVLNPGAGQVVPTSFRTDGTWIWTDSVAYYLEQYGMAPDEELAAHIDARWRAGDVSAETDGETADLAANFLLFPPPEHVRQAAWIPEPTG